MASCGVPTDPPVTAEPTTIWPSISPSLSSKPSIFKTKPPTGSPTELSNVVYYLKETDHPTIATTPEPSIPNDEIPSAEAKNEEENENKTPSPTKFTGDVNDKYFDPDDPLGTFFCGSDWNHAITECPHRCPSGEAAQCPNGWSCYAFTPCFGVGIDKPPTTKPTWEPTKDPTPKPTKAPTPLPTSIEQNWNAQNDEINAQGVQSAVPVPLTSQTPTKKPVWWTPIPTPKPSLAPTEDRCRGVPCDYKGECRSRLGFCGTGIVYCNSASSWVPDCGGASQMIKLKPTKSPTNGIPTVAPSTNWEAWFAENNGNTEDGAVTADVDENDSSANNTTEDAAASNSTAEAEEEEEEAGEEEEEAEEEEEEENGPPPDFTDAWANNWDSRTEVDEQNEDFRWWVERQNSSSTPIHSIRIVLVAWGLFFMIH